MATTKEGMEIMLTESTASTRSMVRPCQTTARQPSPMPETSAIDIATAPRNRVLGKTSRIISDTGRFDHTS